MDNATEYVLRARRDLQMATDEIAIVIYNLHRQYLEFGECKYRREAAKGAGLVYDRLSMLLQESYLVTTATAAVALDYQI